MTTRLAHGEFIGEAERRAVPHGFQVSLHHSSLDPASISERPHAHSEAHFMLLISPGYVSDADGAPEVSEGALLIFNPAGTEHRDYFVAPGGRFLAVSAPAATLIACEDAQRLPGAPTVLEHHAPNLAARRLASAMRLAQPDLEQLEALCLELIAGTGGSRRGRGQPPRWLAEARSLLVGSAPAPIAKVAAALDVHPVHLARVFRAHLNCTPAEYRRRARADHAARRLQSGRGSLAVLAAELGYADQSHLTNEFVRWYGCTPAQFARQP